LTQSNGFVSLVFIPTLLSFLIFPLHAESLNPPSFNIFDHGSEFPVLYENYGEFRELGTNRYKYVITDRPGLRKAMGAGLYPSNAKALMKDPAFKKWRASVPPNFNPWDYVNSGNPQADFYAWVLGPGISQGNRLFFAGKALEEAGHLKWAIKAYHAVLVLFPRQPCWSSDRSYVWYPAEKALSRIESLTKHYPGLGVRLRGARFKVKNGRDTSLKNDVFVIHPGHWEKYERSKTVDLAELKIIKRRGKGKVRLVQYENGHWQLLKNGKPFIVRGLTYHPTKVGHDLVGREGNRWMFEDQNKNGKADAPFESWIDSNGNGIQEAEEKNLGDFVLMQQMGANAIRLFRLSNSLRYDPTEFNKKLLRVLHRQYGIHVILADFVGAYTVGSGASWEEGTDYTDKSQLKTMKQLLKAYVLDHKDEPYVLMWLLGNENLMVGDYTGVNATRTQASRQVKEYLKFINELAKMIHKLDPDHPVAVGNLDLFFLEEHPQYAPAIDIFGVNAYRGNTGFGDIWRRVKENFDRPVLITEYGVDAFNVKSKTNDEEEQLKYHNGSWKNIALHLAGGSEEGNAIGGLVFEYLDEWWKSPSGSPWDHDKVQDSPMSFHDGWSSEEWFGLMSQGRGEKSPLLRVPRKAYYLYRDELWAQNIDVR